ncbi:hypothetical protein C8Q80DRAFT_1185833 [Daedaleopsis nitida]|nr:hypothetical protein C8Q80DRAFT_1185833 [Daedaleopsis nitida]
MAALFVQSRNTNSLSCMGFAQSQMASLSTSQNILFDVPIPSVHADPLLLEQHQLANIPQAVYVKTHDVTASFEYSGTQLPPIYLSYSPGGRSRSGIPGIRMNELLQLPPDVLRARIPGFDDTRILEVLLTHVFIKIHWPGYERMDFTARVYLSEEGAGGVSCNGEFAIEVARCYAKFLEEAPNFIPEGYRPQWHIRRNDPTFTLEQLVLVAINHRFDGVFQADVALVRDLAHAASGCGLPTMVHQSPTPEDVGPWTTARRGFGQAQRAGPPEASYSLRGVQNAPLGTASPPSKLRRLDSDVQERGGPTASSSKGRAKTIWQPSCGIGTGNACETCREGRDRQQHEVTFRAWVPELADDGRARGTW